MTRRLAGGSAARSRHSAAADDALTPFAHLDAWRDETGSTFDVRVFPGGHFYLEPERAAVLAQLSAILAPLLVAADREPAA